MKYADISGLSAQDLSKKVTQLQTEIFEAKMKNSLGQLANPMVIRNNRRDIARLKTAAAAKTTAPAKTPKKAAKTKAAKG